jgi:broad specificity phosphatase PhoE
MTDQTSLLFVRHMETAGNCSDPLLSDQCRQEMNELLTALRKYPISRVYSSDLWRAVAPAEIISKTLGVPRKGSSSLREIRSGIEVPRPPNATEKASNVEDLDAMDSQARIDIERFEERIAKAVDDVVAENENSHVVVVTHSETIRAACQHLLELPLSSCDIPPPADGGIVILTRDSSGIWHSET